MKKITFVCVFFLVLAGLGACKKNEQDKTFKDKDRIQITGASTNQNETDSLAFSFATLPTSTIEYKLDIRASIGGSVSAMDRTFSLAVDPAKTTAVENTDFILPSSLTIKANAVSALIPITIKRTEAIANKTLRLTVKLVSNENFELGKKTSYLLTWTDDVIRPKTWASGFQFYLGDYSKVKHRLILSSTPEYPDLNLIDPSINSGLYDTIFYIASAARLALLDYNNTHPGEPLKNELGDIIGICTGCK